MKAELFFIFLSWFHSIISLKFPASNATPQIDIHRGAICWFHVKVIISQTRVNLVYRGALHDLSKLRCQKYNKKFYNISNFDKGPFKYYITMFVFFTFFRPNLNLLMRDWQLSIDLFYVIKQSLSPKMFNNENLFTLIQMIQMTIMYLIFLPFLAILSPTVCSSFTKLRFRWSFWGAYRI